MGTGVVSALLHNLPYHSDSVALKIASLAIFLLNLVLFTFVCTCTILRYTMFPEVSHHSCNLLALYPHPPRTGIRLRLSNFEQGCAVPVSGCRRKLRILDWTAQPYNHGEQAAADCKLHFRIWRVWVGQRDCDFDSGDMNSTLTTPGRVEFHGDHVLISSRVSFRQRNDLCMVMHQHGT